MKQVVDSYFTTIPFCSLCNQEKNSIYHLNDTELNSAFVIENTDFNIE